MNLIGNLLWLLLGGLIIAIEYLVASVFLMITIIGIPFGLQTLKLAKLALLPFGKQIEREPTSTGCTSTVFNITWIFIGGIWIAATHLFFGIICFITIIGIPFANQHFKLFSLAFTPFGTKIK